MRFGEHKGTDMKSFRQYLSEGNDHPHLVDVTSHKDTPHITTHFYRDPETGVHTRIHTDTKRNISYWGFQVPDTKGKLTDVAPPDVPKELRKARLSTAFGHIAHFVKSNPSVRAITYQTNEGERGERNHAIFQAKWPEIQKEHGIETPLVRVDQHPLR